MNIGFFLPSLVNGGVARSTLTLAHEFTRRGHSVQVYTLQGAVGTLTKRLAADDLQIIELAATRAIRALPALIRLLRHNHLDAIISATHYANIVAATAKLMARSKCVLICTERVSPYEDFKEQPIHKRLVLPNLMRLTYRTADAIVTVSQECGDELARLLKIKRNRITTIYNPVDFANIRSAMEHPAGCDWADDKKYPLIMGVGRLVAQKDFATLMRAFAKVRHKHKVRLAILGDGQEREALEALSREFGVADAITMPGFVSNPHAWMAKADVFVLSSTYEGLSNALVEALVCNVATVSTACPTGSREVLLDGRAGHLVAVGDWDAMAGAIMEALGNGNQGREQAIRESLQRFVPAVAAESYLSVIEDAITRSNRKC